jgi:hypothetical protein
MRRAVFEETVLDSELPEAAPGAIGASPQVESSTRDVSGPRTFYVRACDDFH